MADYLNGLNKEQYDAATTINGPMLVIAGAGSGKTKVLVSRVAYMLDNGIPANEILLLTFTNKAAQEMKDRVVSDIGNDAADITACTFHSFCAEFLRKHGVLINIKPNFSILSTADCKEAMSLAMQEYFDRHNYQPYKDFPNKNSLFYVYSTSVNNCMSIHDVVKYDSKLASYETEIAEILNNYKNYKMKHNTFDYDDLLFLTKLILENYENVRAKMDAHFKYISCDEFQDTNIIQDLILNLLSKDYPNLAVVGDDNQSIYKFRGANIDNILTFEKRHAGCKKVILHQNYRSTQEILDVSNAIMEHAREGEKKVLHGQCRGVMPRLFTPNNNEHEAETIAHMIQQYKLAGAELKDIAVISRWSTQTTNLEILLNKMNIPFKKFGGLKFLEKDVIQDILSFIRVIVNEKDELALYRLLKLYPGIGEKTARKLTMAVYKNGLVEITNIKTSVKYYDYMIELYKVLCSLMYMSLDDQLSYLVEDYYPNTALRTIDLSNMSTVAKKEKKDKIARQLEEAKMLIVLAANYKSAEQYLADLILEAVAPKSDEDYVNLTTIHSAKGLEYKTVFVMDLIDGVTPKTEKGTDDDNEELRCLYVALTRAKKNLYLFAPRSYCSGGFNTYQTLLSHFMNYNDVVQTLDAQNNVALRQMRQQYSYW